MPQFPGGEEALMNHIGRSMRYPIVAQERGIQGTVVCSFVITAEGAVVDAKVVRGLSPEIDSEAMRVILNMPKWIPGKKDGVNVAVSYTIPIVLTLNRDNKDN
jgi:protein TonB